MYTFEAWVIITNTHTPSEVSKTVWRIKNKNGRVVAEVYSKGMAERVCEGLMLGLEKKKKRDAFIL